MPSNAAKNFSECDRGLVLAPAGCGKTHLIAESVGHATGRQLVLTHTLAGVDALRTKLTNLGVPAAKYRVTTIDSLALSYSSAFPRLAGWDCRYPNDDKEWSALRVATCRLLDHDAPRRVLRASYAGVFVDEYQDCCGTQHAMISKIADVLPCRIVGDPLQAIYRKLHGNDVAEWSQVERLFPIVDVLTEPYRWRKRNPELGEWLIDVRSRLERGNEIDFANGSSIIEWIPSADVQDQIATCYRAFDRNSVVAICDWPSRCAAVAGKTRGHFTVLESVGCPDLLRAAETIENSIGLKRVEFVVGFARRCFTGMTLLNDLLDRMKKGKAYAPRSPDKVRLWAAMQEVAESTDLRAVEKMMTAIAGLSDAHFYIRRELWSDMMRVLRINDSSSGKSLRDSAWSLRDHARRYGRAIPQRTIATPLLIKGLEFEHALLLDAMHMGTAEELYVALTRGSRSLTVLSSKRKVRHEVPAWIAEASQATDA
ncbi:MAG: UvrD-helicase domain-containing protein [Bacillota bacterium]